VLIPQPDSIRTLLNIFKITGKDPEFIPLTPYGKNAAEEIDKIEAGSKVRLSHPTMK
jgi:hypothetical protein